jgi:hypothetical protein
MKMLQLERGGDFAKSLEMCRKGALLLYEELKKDERFVPLFAPELDIVVWAVRAKSATEASRKARMIFEEAAANDLHLALSTFPRVMLDASNPVQEWDDNHITCLRACVMKPEHHEWMAEIVKRLKASTNSALKKA